MLSNIPTTFDQALKVLSQMKKLLILFVIIEGNNGDSIF